MADDSVVLPSFQSGTRPEDMPLSVSSFDRPYQAIAKTPDELTGTGYSGAPDVGSSMADVGSSLAAGWHGAIAGGAGLLATTVVPSEYQSGYQATIQQQRREADIARSQITPGVEGGLRHPLIWAAEQAPGIGEMAGAAVVGGLVGGPVGAAVGAGAATAASTEGDVAADLISKGITPSPGAMAAVGAAGFVGGALTEGMGPLVGKMVTSPAAKIALGVGGGSVTFAGQAAATDIITQREEQRAGQRESIDPWQTAQAGINALGTGAILSGAGAILHGRGEKPPPPPRVETPTEDLGKTQIDHHEKADDKAGGQAAPVRSDRVAKKPEARRGVTPGVGGDVGPPPAPSPVGGPDVAIAATGTGAKPSAEAGTPPGPVPGAEAPAPVKPTKGPKAEKPAPAPPGTPPTPDMVRQREEVMDKNHPRDVMLYPPGTEVPPIPAGLSHSWGKFDLGDNYGTLVYDRNLKGGSGISGPKIMRHREAGTEYEFIRDALQSAHERSAAHEAAKIAPAEVPPTEKAPPRPPEAPPAAETPPPATPVAAEARPPSEAAPEAPRAEPAAVVEAPVEQPRVGRDQTKGFKALVEELNTTKQEASPEEAKWLGEFGVGRREDGSYGPVEAGKLAAVGEAAQAKAAIKTEELAKAAGREKSGAEMPTAEKVAPGVTEEPKKSQILEAKLTPEEQLAHKGAALKAREAARKALEAAKKEEKRQARIKKELETGEAQKAESHKGKEAEKAREENNAKAREVVMRHLPKGDETPQEQHARARAMMKDAVESGVHIPDKFKGQHGRSDDVILLAEARARIGKGEGNNAAFIRFKDREGAYYREAGKIGEVRRAESAELGAKGSKAKSEEGKEEAIPEAGALETHIEEPEEKIAAEQARLKAEGEDARLRAEQAAHEAKLAAEPAKEPFKPVEEYKPEVAGAAKEAPVVTRRGKYGGFRPEITGGKVSLRKPGEVLAHKLAPLKDREKTSDRLVHTEGPDEQPVRIKTVFSRKVRDVIREHFDASRYYPTLRGMMTRLVDAVVEIAGDKDVHFVKDDEMQRIYGGSVDGTYSTLFDHILLNMDTMSESTPLHEVFHAASAIAINEKPELQAKILKIRQEILDSQQLSNIRRGLALQGKDLPWEVQYTLSNYALHPGEAEPSSYQKANEFLTGIMTHPEVQEYLQGIKISKALANELKIPKWRKGTMWEGVLSVIRDALGMGPRDTSAIEAAMAVTEGIVQHQIPGEMERFQIRSIKADLAERLGPKGALMHRIMDPAAKAEDEERFGERYAKAATMATQDALSSGWTKTKSNVTKVQSGPSLEATWGKMFTDDKGNIIKDLRTLSGRMHVELEKMREADSPLYETALLNAKKFSEHMPDYAKLKEITNGTKIDATKPYSPKGKKADFNKDIDGWRTNANWKEANRLYEKLPPELQKQFTDEITFGKDKAKQISEGFLHSVMDHFNLPAGVTDKAEMLKRILDNEMTDDDREHYTNLKAMGEIAEAQRLMRGEKNFFPAYREGKYVVNGKREMPAGGHDTTPGGNKLPDNVREFDGNDRAGAHKYFTGDHKMHPTADIVYYAKDTDERVSGLAKEEAEDNARGGPSNVVKRIEVKLQREHMELHDSAPEAERARQSMIADGIKDVSGVLNRREDRNWGRINPEFARNVKRNIDHSSLSDEGKEAAAEAVRSFMLVRQSAIQSHLVHRRYVGGADYDNAEGIRSYSEAANRHLVNSKYGAERDALMERMENQEKANQSKPDISTQSSAVANELRARVYRSPEDLALKTPWIVRQAQTVAYFHYMMGPRHMAMMQTHPIVYSAPQMAGRHGPGIYKLMHDTFRDIGGPLQGAKGALQATWNFGKLAKAFITRDHEAVAKLAKMPNTLKSMFSKLKGDELEDMTKLTEIGVIPPGFSNDFMAATGKNKFEHFMQEFNHAYDVQNRVGVALTAYRAELKLTGDRAKAIDYARNIVENTIGSNTPMDIGTVMKNPMAKMFMQFKHFPLRQTELLMRNVYSAFRGESPEIRAEAGKAAMYQIATSFTGAGVNGLPKSLLKPLVLFGYVMGVTPSPTQIDDRVRRFLADIFGATGANMFMDGALAAFPHAPNLTNMFSRDMDFAFGEPQQTKTGVDMASWLGQTVLGAPGSVMIDALKGGRAMLNGEYQKGFTYMPGPRLMSDIARSWNMPDQGLVTLGGKQLTAPSDLDMVTRILGFQTQEAEKAYEGRAMAQEEIQAAQAEKKAHPTKAEELKAQARAKREKTTLGIPESKSNRAILQKYQEVYQ